MSAKSAPIASSDRAIRSLLQLEASASTSRTMNLVAAWRRHGETQGYRAAPFFKNQVLNRSIILKHRLRANERDALPHGRSSATKVILPIDPTDLRLGARSLFVGQRNYEDLIEELIGEGFRGGHDSALLSLLDGLPSFDPFLMREQLKRNGFTPDRCYFDLTEADTARMIGFVRQELTPLIGRSFGDLDARINDKTSRLAQKLLANTGDADLEPLRHGLSMGQQEFDEGMFCWKGFIYYKWTLSELLPKIRPVAGEIGKIRPIDQLSSDDKAYIEAARLRLTRAVARACDTVRVTLRVYDDAYNDLTHNGQPNAFREFLLKAPSLFHELGERLGSVHHIVSFWRYRFPAGARPKITGEELFDIFADFEASLSFETTGQILA